jgi:protein-disulfide isomerase
MVGIRGFSRTEVAFLVCAIIGLFVVWRIGTTANSSTNVANSIKKNVISHSALTNLGATLIESNSKDSVIQILDYECPPCHASESICQEFRTNSPKVRWVIVQFPLPFHKNAAKLAQAALVAEDNGWFVKFHSLVMKSAIKNSESVDQYLVRQFPDVTFKTEEMASKMKLVNDQVSQLKKLGIKGTPTFVCYREDGQSILTNDPRKLDSFFARTMDLSMLDAVPCKVGENCID